MNNCNHNIWVATRWGNHTDVVAYFQLRTLRLITRSLSVDAAKTLVQSFITCRLDYCNALLSGITDSLFRRLQSDTLMSRAAAFCTDSVCAECGGTTHQSSPTHVEATTSHQCSGSYSGCRFEQRVDFKLALLVLHRPILSSGSEMRNVTCVCVCACVFVLRALCSKVIQCHTI